MAQMFHFSLTGYVGGSAFNAAGVRRNLDSYAGQHVDVMIDSFGGSLTEGLAISSAFRDHGDVTVHFRGASASAATIAAMGAAKVSISPEALILVHKVSMEFFDWADRNADQLEDFIAALEKAKDELDALDAHVASLYARRCKKPAAEMLALMKREVWLSPQQALEYGFVDEISEAEADDDFKPTISKAQAYAFQELGLPLPPVKVDSEDISAFRSILNAIKSLFYMDNKSSQDGAGAKASAQATGNDVTNAEANGNNAGSAAGQGAGAQAQAADIDSLRNEVTELRNSVTAISQSVGDMINALNALTPGKSAKTTNVVSQAVASGNEEKKAETSFDRFAKTSKSAKALFDSLP